MDLWSLCNNNKLLHYTKSHVNNWAILEPNKSLQKYEPRSPKRLALKPTPPILIHWLAAIVVRLCFCARHCRPSLLLSTPLAPENVNSTFSSSSSLSISLFPSQSLFFCFLFVPLLQVLQISTFHTVLSRHQGCWFRSKHGSYLHPFDQLRVWYSCNL